MKVAKSLFWAAGAAALTPLLEYAWHAWLAHGKRPHETRTSHLDHHAKAGERVEPWEEMRRNAPRVLKTLGVVVGVFAPFVGVGAALPFAAGLGLGYMGITLGHARMHRRAPKNAWERWMWRFHFHHHFGNARVNYGLVTPIFDFVFDTVEMPETVVIPEAAKPVWLTTDVPGFSVRPSRRAA